MLSGSTFDVFGALDYLFRADRQEVRDHLVNMMYDFELREVDFVLPQLCTLFCVWEEDKSASLMKFLVHLCAKSIHCGVRLVLLLSSKAAYCADKEQMRCLRLLEECEIAVVNSHIDEEQVIVASHGNKHLAERRRERKERLRKRRHKKDKGGKRRANADKKKGDRKDREDGNEEGGELRQPAAAAAPSSVFAHDIQELNGNEDGDTCAVAAVAAAISAASGGGGVSEADIQALDDAQAEAQRELIEERRMRILEASQDIFSSSAAEEDGRSGGGVGVGGSGGGVGGGGGGGGGASDVLRATSPSSASPIPPIHKDKQHLPRRYRVRSTRGDSGSSASSSPAPASSTPASSSESALHRPSGDVAEPSSPLALGSPPPTDAILDDDIMFDLFISKQIRSEYFNALLALMNTLEQLSQTLVKVPRDSRKKYLREYLEVLNMTVIHDLYFPCCSVDMPHYKILRVLPAEGVALSSRDKAPFLMVVEVSYTGRTCGSSQVHQVFKYEDVEQRRMQDAPHYAPYEDASNPTSLTDRSLDEHVVHQDYFTPERALSPKREVRKLSVSGDDPAEGQHVWVSADAVLPEESVLKARTASMSPEELVREAERLAAREAFGEPWDTRKARLRMASPYRDDPNWDLKSVIFKGGDDCRQELLAMQLIMLFDDIFCNANLPLKLCTYDVYVTSPNSGIIETIPNAHSVDTIKRNVQGFVSLAKFFEDRFGRGTAEFDTAQRNFVESMAAYSVVTYLLQIKDRHNGNIMLCADGGIVHIDFGFMLSNSPGGNFNFESAPFKLTREYMEVMDGEDSEAFSYFKMMFIRGFLEARAQYHKIMSLVEIMLRGPAMNCFLGGENTLLALRDRFMPGASEGECMEHAIALIEESIDNWRSVEYDKYQRITNGIL